MNNLSISLLVMLIAVTVALVVVLIYNYRAKKNSLDDLFIFIDDRPKEKKPIGDHRYIRVPSGSKYKANIYPDDQLILQDRKLIIAGPFKRKKVIERDNPTDDVILTIKKGTQQPITRV